VTMVITVISVIRRPAGPACQPPCGCQEHSAINFLTAGPGPPANKTPPPLTPPALSPFLALCLKSGPQDWNQGSSILPAYVYPCLSFPASRCHTSCPDPHSIPSPNALGHLHPTIARGWEYHIMLAAALVISQTQVRVSALLLTGYVTLGRFLSFSGPWACHPQSETNNGSLLQLLQSEGSELLAEGKWLLLLLVLLFFSSIGD
jgi:hypothetical protein